MSRKKFLDEAEEEAGIGSGSTQLAVGRRVDFILSQWESFKSERNLVQFTVF